MWLMRGDHVRTDSFPGVACWFIAECPEHYDCAVVRMVGDDQEHHVDATEVHAIADDAFCGGCGQIGCGHG